jgi:hypothetical protein
MAAKLKSILKQIHWSSILRAAIFALAWFWLPFWLFLLIALYLYFVPLFQAGKLAIPFLALLFLCFIEPTGLIFAVVFGALFYGILLVKDLILIDRRSAYEIVVLMLSFIFFRAFYLKFDKGIDGYALISSFLIAAVFGLLLNAFVDCFKESISSTALLKRVAVLLSFVLMWQILIVGLFLPIDFVYQSVLAFLGAILLTDLVPEHLFGGLTRAKVLTTATAVFTLLVIVLGSARWGL